MFTVSNLGIGIVLVLFIVFLIKAYISDQQYFDLDTQPSQPTDFRTAVVETIEYENKRGQFAESKVKKIITSARDMVIRAAIMGVIEGSLKSGLQNAVVWSLAGGIVSGVSDLFGWNNKFN